MSLTPVINDLRSEREKIAQALAVLESLNGPRRGRPPGWLKKPVAVEAAQQVNGRKPFSLATRRLSGHHSDQLALHCHVGNNAQIVARRWNNELMRFAELIRPEKEIEQRAEK